MYEQLIPSHAHGHPRPLHVADTRHRPGPVLEAEACRGPRCQRLLLPVSLSPGGAAGTLSSSVLLQPEF